MTEAWPSAQPQKHYYTCAICGFETDNPATAERHRAEGHGLPAIILRDGKEAIGSDILLPLESEPPTVHNAAPYCRLPDDKRDPPGCGALSYSCHGTQSRAACRRSWAFGATLLRDIYIM